MTESQVRAKLGRPTRITQSRGPLGVVVIRLYYERLRVDLQGLGAEPVVVRILTTRPTERTASGVGVGSTLTAVKQMRGVHCWWEAAEHYCAIGNRNKPLNSFITFWIGPHQRVNLVSVSLVVNS